MVLHSTTTVFPSAGGQYISARSLVPQPSFTMPSYKLSYFPARGIAEVSRQILHLSGTEFEDVRITHAEWPSKKSQTPFGFLPVLEVDGKQLSESFAIARYLARQFGFVGKSDWESALVDSYGDQFKDYSLEIRPYLMIMYGFVEGDKEVKRKEIGEPARDKLFGLLEKTLGASSSGFLVGDSLTWIDLLVADHVDVLEGLVPGFLDGYPKVRALKAKLHACPKLAGWLAKRPATPF